MLETLHSEVCFTDAWKISVTAGIELRSDPGISQFLGRDLVIEVVGFGCPAIVSKNIALDCETFVTTVINDGALINHRMLSHHKSLNLPRHLLFVR